MKTLSIPKSKILKGAYKRLDDIFRIAYDYISDTLKIERSFLNGHAPGCHPQKNFGAIFDSEWRPIKFSFFDHKFQEWEAIPEIIPLDKKIIMAKINNAIRKKEQDNDKFINFVPATVEIEINPQFKIWIDGARDYNLSIEEAKEYALYKGLKNNSATREAVDNFFFLGQRGEEMLLWNYKKLKKETKIWLAFKQSGLSIDCFFAILGNPQFTYKYRDGVKEIKKDDLLEKFVPKTFTVCSRFWDGEYEWKAVKKDVSFNKENIDAAFKKYNGLKAEIDPFILELMTAVLPEANG